MNEKKFAEESTTSAARTAPMLDFVLQLCPGWGSENAMHANTLSAFLRSIHAVSDLCGRRYGGRKRVLWIEERALFAFFGKVFFLVKRTTALFISRRAWTTLDWRRIPDSSMLRSVLIGVEHTLAILASGHLRDFFVFCHARKRCRISSFFISLARVN